MLTPEEIIKKLQPLNLSYLSREIGISYVTIWKFSKNKLTSIPYELVKTLSDYFNAK